MSKILNKYFKSKLTLSCFYMRTVELEIQSYICFPYNKYRVYHTMTENTKEI